MKITKLNTYLVRPRWCFLEIETDEEWAMIEEVLADFQEDELLADEED